MTSTNSAKLMVPRRVAAKELKQPCRYCWRMTAMGPDGTWICHDLPNDCFHARWGSALASLNDHPTE